MDKITFRFNLLKVRFPDLHQKALEKIEGGMDRKDIVTDWLVRLECLEEFVGHRQEGKPQIAQAAEKSETDLDAAKNIMSGLLD